MSKSSKDGWTWEPRVCCWCDKPVLKSQSFGCSFAYMQTWHTDCGTRPKTF